jgi:hypothetical protein
MAESNGNEPATRADLRAFEDRLIQILTRSQAEILEKTQAFIQHRQIELLRAFERAAAFEDAEGFLTLRDASIENPPWDKV